MDKSRCLATGSDTLRLSSSVFARTSIVFRVEDKNAPLCLLEDIVGGIVELPNRVFACHANHLQVVEEVHCVSRHECPQHTAQLVQIGDQLPRLPRDCRPGRVQLGNHLFLDRAIGDFEETILLRYLRTTSTLSHFFIGM